MEEQLSIYGVDNGFSDYPGRYAVTVYLPGCNLSCPFCFNRELIAYQKGNASYEEFKSYLKQLRESGVNPAVVLSGGEPTLHPIFQFFCDKLSDGGVDLGLHTNGIFLPEQIIQGNNPFKSVILSLKPTYFVGMSKPEYWGKIFNALNIYKNSEHKQVRIVSLPEYKDDYEESLKHFDPILKALNWEVKWVDAVMPNVATA